MNDFDLFMAARRLVELIFEYAEANPTDPEDLWLEDRRGREPNHSILQTLNGLFLSVFADGRPHALWTPWGVWEFTFMGTGDWKSVMRDDILPRLGAMFHQELRLTDDWGDVGPAGAVYAIHCIDHRSLPDPVERPREQGHAFSEEAQMAWKRLSARAEAAA